MHLVPVARRRGPRLVHDGPAGAVAARAHARAVRDVHGHRRPAAAVVVVVVPVGVAVVVVGMPAHGDMLLGVVVVVLALGLAEAHSVVGSVVVRLCGDVDALGCDCAGHLELETGRTGSPVCIYMIMGWWLSLWGCTPAERNSSKAAGQGYCVCGVQGCCVRGRFSVS